MRAVIINVSLFFLLIISVTCSCQNEVTPEVDYVTENVIVIVMDGARFSETWGDSTHQYIPHLSAQIAPLGVVNSQFYNNGPTYTSSGHTSITTGFYQEINNSGNELPKYPSFFQYFNAKNGGDNQFTWLITSKDKLEVLANCQYTRYKDKFNPVTNCGINGNGSGYREDSVTLKIALESMLEYHPKLMLINFKEPDNSAHQNNWTQYLTTIKNTDEYISRIWDFVQNDSIYKGKTTIFVTNDHGRHLDGVQSGFTSHGDDCAGCRHLMLFAYGPDFKEGVVVDRKRDLIDITATISELLHLDMRYSKGRVMVELFK